MQFVNIVNTNHIVPNYKFKFFNTLCLKCHKLYPFRYMWEIIINDINLNICTMCAKDIDEVKIIFNEVLNTISKQVFEKYCKK